MTNDRNPRRDASHRGASRRPVDPGLSVDEAWLTEWVAEGIAELEALLAAHAAFDAYLAASDNAGDDDDGR